MNNLSPNPRQRLRNAPVGVLASLLATLRAGCIHRWGWPRTEWVGPANHRRREVYQCCSRCGTEREYRGELANGA
jgi:hypothetical protein